MDWFDTANLGYHLLLCHKRSSDFDNSIPMLVRPGNVKSVITVTPQKYNKNPGQDHSFVSIYNFVPSPDCNVCQVKVQHDNISCSNQDENESEDDDSVKEYYSAFNKRDSTAFTCNDVENKADTLCVANDNLICTGDVVKFHDIMVNSAIKRDSIVTIENSIVLKSGDILHPTKHAICKVEVYCSATQDLHKQSSS